MEDEFHFNDHGSGPRPAGQGADERDEALKRMMECGHAELQQLLEATTQLDVPSARAALRNPHVDAACIELLGGFRSLHAAYEFRRDIVLHRKTPAVLASRFLPTLFWRDLARVGASVSLRPGLRRAADQILLQRLPRLTLGERIALSRIAGAGLLVELGRSPQPRVILAWLENPRLTEGMLLRVVTNPSVGPETLTSIAANGRWGTRYSVRLALVRNPRTPLDRAVGLVAGLRKADQKALARERTLREAIRRRSRLLSGGQV